MGTIEESFASRRQEPFGGVATPIERFAAVVEKYADRPAILEDGGSGPRPISYSELDEMANRVANGILVGGGDDLKTVAILTGESGEHIAAMLGAMKAGMTIAPLHPSNPQARLEYIVEHSGAGLVLSDTVYRERASALSSSVMTVEETASQSAEEPRIELDPLATARIMYTSGSTGKPKGVMQSHRYMLGKTWVETAFYEYGPEDRLSQLLPLSFAASTSHTMGALLNGGTLCPFDVPVRGMHHLAGWIRKTGITGLGMVPTLFRRFLTQDSNTSSFETVRYVFVGGELVLRTDVELYRRLFPDHSVFIHRLAATETGAITRFVINKDTVLPDAVVPAGYAAEGKHLVIVDDGGEPVPDGEVGELWVRSNLLSSGYWNDPELTAKNFGVDEEDPELRIFRTGDLATRDDDNKFVHLGRKDGRVKIRGYGVDVVEVERTLLAIPGVIEGAVVVDDTKGEIELAAAYVGEPSLDPPQMRRRLQERVPDYMVPTSLTRLERLPLTPRGKIDRKALVGLDSEPASPGEYVAPASEIEGQLHTLWCKSLGLERVSVVESFFDLGGSSIQAYELVGDIYRELSVDLPATSLLEASTIRTQAALIASGGPTSTRRVVAIRATGSLTPIFGVPGGGGGVLYLQKLAAYIDEDRPIYGLPRDMSTAEIPQYRTVEEMANGYLAEMRSVQASGPYVLLGSCFGGQVAHEMARLLHLEGERVDLLITVDPPTPGWDGKEHWRHRPWTREWVIGKARRRARRIVTYPKRRKLRRSGELERHQQVLNLSKKANREHGPGPCPVPMVVLAAENGSARQEWYWSRVATGGLEIEEFNTNHSEMYTPSNRKVIAAMIQRRLDGIDSAPATPRD